MVAPILARDGADHVLFTKRAEDLADHPGQMSFPGGGREPEDADLLATALREADEEVGRRTEEVDLVGQQHFGGDHDCYETMPGVQRLLDAVPAAWDDTRFVDGSPGSEVTLARRSGTDWFVGSIIGGEGREVSVPIGFLDYGVTYADGSL